MGCEMQGISNRVRVLAVDGRMIGEAMSALAVGALLGVLVAAPYDRIFGISQPFYTVLQAAMGTAEGRIEIAVGAQIHALIRS